MAASVNAIASHEKSSLIGPPGIQRLKCKSKRHRPVNIAASNSDLNVISTFGVCRTFSNSEAVPIDPRHTIAFPPRIRSSLCCKLAQYANRMSILCS